MDLKDEVRSSFRRSHDLARKYYDKGNLSKARVEYLKCAQFTEQLAKLTPSKRKEFQEKAKKFRDIAEGLKGGSIKVYTGGIMPEGKKKSSKPRTNEDSEDGEDQAENLILAEKPSLKFKDIAGLDRSKRQSSILSSIRMSTDTLVLRAAEESFFTVPPGAARR